MDTDGRSDGIATPSGRMLRTDEHPDVILGPPGGCLGSNFSILKSTYNLLEAHI
jgi:hypothetical protein